MAKTSRVAKDAPPQPAPVSAAGGRAAADLAAGRRVMAQARAGIAALEENLGAAFLACLDLIGGISGRVIVSGVGKSGHVGRKIAATLASTGTPAFFVHAGEASHGDLGMIAAGDAVLAISNSGEAAELRDLIAYTRRYGIPLTAITSRASSTLAQSADCVLVLPDVAEACPLGLAPTTSTTMTLALGDAIAVALLERRGFTADDYKVFHPGGQLGRKLFKVDELMHVGAELPLVKPATPMADVVLTMTQKTFGVAGVVDDAGRLMGIVTDGDLRRHMRDSTGDLFALTAVDVMTKTPKTTRRSLLAAEALRRMNEAKVTCVFVVEDEIPVGILRLHDILRAGAV
ncbi:MAG: KpsF/GutQ family sugar-phosphate isomerase [Rhodospirillaceae bacterium]|nr:MAG: KpsF/GutQ family sugar-phosphate isomerase [Rhodospirillaceae bacterium]